MPALSASGGMTTEYRSIVQIWRYFFLSRTFVILSLRAGMHLHFVQGQVGHTTPTMTLHYAQVEDIDLVEAHKQHSPVDRL